MRQELVNVYTVNELTEAARNKAYYRWIDSDSYGWHEENKNTLEAFAELFPVSIMDWEYDTHRGHVRFEFDGDDDGSIEELSGVRLATYIYNNYWDSITKGKYYSLWSEKDVNPHYTEGGHAPKGKLKSRHSKVMTVTLGACPFTGYYMDDVILDPIFEFLKRPTASVTFSELMKYCLNNWAKACASDFEASTSMEYFIEQAKANEWEFYGDGRMV